MYVFEYVSLLGSTPHFLSKDDDKGFTINPGLDNAHVCVVYANEKFAENVTGIDRANFRQRKVKVNRPLFDFNEYNEGEYEPFYATEIIKDKP